MGKILEFLKGKKTYLVAVGLAILTFLLNAGIIDQATYDQIYGYLTALGLLTLRAGVAKV